MSQPQRITIPTADATALGGFLWRHPPRARDGVAEPAGAARGGHGCGRDGGPGLVIINAATSVRCRYYSRFAEYLHGHGFDVLTYDYRGIGESRPASMRGFQASWMDWGQKDFEAVLTYARREFPGQPVDVAAHSIGGFVTGLAPSSHCLRRIFTMGAQYAYWRDYAPERRLRMLAKWHLAMLVLTACLGYFRPAAGLAGGRRAAWCATGVSWGRASRRAARRPTARIRAWPPWRR